MITIVNIVMYFYACKCYLCNLIDIPCKNLCHFYIMKIHLIISLIHEEKLGGGGKRDGVGIYIYLNCSQHVHIVFSNVVNDVP